MWTQVDARMNAGITGFSSSDHALVWLSHDVSVHKRPLSTAAAAAKSGRPQRTLGTRLERQKRGNLRFFARKKPASPLFLPLGQLPTWFLGRYLSKGFVLLPGVAGLHVLSPVTQNRDLSGCESCKPVT